MFNRKQIKQRAKTALKRRYWMVLLVVVIIGLLGGTFADGWFGSKGSVDLSGVTGGVSGGGSGDVSGDWLPAIGADEGTWEPTLPSDNPWEQYEDDATGNELAAVWESLQAEWNAWVNDFDTQWNAFQEEFRAQWGEQLEEFDAQWGDDLRQALAVLLCVVAVALVIGCVIGILIRVLLINVISLSGHGWMLRHLRGENVGLLDAFAAFRIYKASVRTMFLRDLLVWLWSLLFVIPGIIMRYAYSMVPYILYENPHLSAQQAIRISRTMTRGYKWKLFVLKLSFIGWQLLSVCTGGLVGLVWSNPYVALAHAGAYEDLKWNAIQSGKLSWEDFDQDPPAPLPEDPVVAAWNQPVNGGWNDPTPQWQSPVPQWEAPLPPPPTNPWNTPTDTPW